MLTKIFILILFSAVICATTISVNALDQELIPSWIKNNAKWWSDGKITDEQYISTIQYLVSKGAIKVPSADTQSSNSTFMSFGIQKLVTNIRTNSSVSTGYYGLGQISCNKDEILTGGGYYSSEFREMLSVYRNGPSENGKIWLVEMMYVGPHFYGNAPQFTIYGMCAKLAP